MSIRPDEQQASGLGGLGYRLAFVARQARNGFERRLAEDCGVSFAAWTVLETLAVYGPMIQRDLADALAVSSQTMVRQVDRMVASGWLRRGEVEHDRRAIRIGLTAEGRDVHRRLVLVAQQVNARLIRGLSEAEVKTFDAVLNRILANTDEAQ